MTMPWLRIFSPFSKQSVSLYVSAGAVHRLYEANMLCLVIFYACVAVIYIRLETRTNIGLQDIVWRTIFHTTENLVESFIFL